MNKYEEVLLELDGKIAYADATGNIEAKQELANIVSVVKKLAEGEKDERVLEDNITSPRV